MRSLAIVLLACLLASCGGHRAERACGQPRRAPASPRFGDADPHDWDGIRPWQYPVHGIDVSKYQGDIDWHRVRASGIDFAFIKATEGGDHTDDRFERELGRRPRRRHAARRLPLLLLLPPGGGAGGLVHQPRPARRRARCRRSSTSSGTTSRRPAPTAPTPPPSAARRCLFLQALTVYYGKRPVIYTTVDFYRDNDLGRLRASTSGCARWPAIPSDVYPDQRWAFWQYTGTGLVEGIDGLTDINVFGGTRSQWATWAAKRLTPAAGSVGQLDGKLGQRALVALAELAGCRVSRRAAARASPRAPRSPRRYSRGRRGRRLRCVRDPEMRHRHRRAVHQPVVLGLLEHRRVVDPLEIAPAQPGRRSAAPSAPPGRASRGRPRNSGPSRARIGLEQVGRRVNTDVQRDREARRAPLVELVQQGGDARSGVHHTVVLATAVARSRQPP